MAAFAERRWTSPDGLTLYARDYPGKDGNDRTPVLCLHGFTRNSKDFAELAPFATAFQEYVVDRSVHGPVQRT